MKIHILLLAVLASSLQAEPSDLYLSGFATLGMAISDSKTYAYRSDIGQSDGSFNNKPNFKNSSVLGLQLDYPLNASTDILLQGVYRNQDTVNIDSLTNLAFIRLSPSSDWTARIGRSSLDLFLLTEFRDVGYAYTWAHTPTEAYGPLPFRHLDGADLSYSSQFKGLSLRTNVYVGSSSADISTYKGAGTMKLKDIYGISMSIDTFKWSLQARYSTLRLGSETSSSTINALQALAQQTPNIENIWPDIPKTIETVRTKNNRAEYISLGARLDQDNWSYVAEVSSINTEEAIEELKSAYASVIHHSGNHSWFGIYAVTQTGNFNIDTLGVDEAALANISGGTALFQSVDLSLNFYTPNQSTASLGWRWNFFHQMALKVQWDNTHIDAQGGSLWLNKDSPSKPKETVNTFFTNVSVVF